MSNKKSPLRTKYGVEVPDSAQSYLTFDEEGNELWEIENIIGERIRNDKKEYLVEWKGWSLKYSTWEPESSFIENVDIIRECLKKYHSTQKNANQGIKKMKKLKATRNMKKRGKKTRSEKSNESDDTKIVIRRIPMPLPDPDLKLPEGRSFETNILNNDVDYPILVEPSFKGPLKETGAFMIDDLNDEITTQINTDETDILGNNFNTSTSYWQDKQLGTPIRFGNDSDDDSPEYSRTRLEELEAEKMAQMISCPSQIKLLKGDHLAPLTKDELEKIDSYQRTIKECFAYPPTSVGKEGLFRFRVDFSDNEERMKGYEYFSFVEIKQKNWDLDLLDFFTKEIIGEMTVSGRSFTKNIKLK